MGLTETCYEASYYQHPQSNKFSEVMFYLPIVNWLIN